MFRIDSDKNIEINRGDAGTIKLTNNDGNFSVGDLIKFSVVEKGNYKNVVLQKEIEIESASSIAYITLNPNDTRIGDVISKAMTYWYEIEYNGNQTLIGYDSNKAKKFIIYPEAPNRESD